MTTRPHLAGFDKRSFAERVPHASEANILEVLDVGGGELSYPVMTQGQGQPRIVDSAVRKNRTGGHFPEPLHDVRLGAWIVQPLPSGMGSESPDYVSRLTGAERAFGNRGVAQQPVKLDQHQFAKREPFGIAMAIQKSNRPRMTGRLAVQRGKQDVRVAGCHDDRPLRLARYGAGFSRTTPRPSFSSYRQSGLAKNASPPRGLGSGNSHGVAAGGTLGNRVRSNSSPRRTSSARDISRSAAIRLTSRYKASGS